MPWRELGALLLVMVLLVAAGNLWFHLVEGVLARLKGLLPGRRPPERWHPLPPEEEREE